MVSAEQLTVRTNRGLREPTLKTEGAMSMTEMKKTGCFDSLKPLVRKEERSVGRRQAVFVLKRKKPCSREPTELLGRTSRKKKATADAGFHRDRERNWGVRKKETW